jgi:hypothetical protein
MLERKRWVVHRRGAEGAEGALRKTNTDFKFEISNLKSEI